MHNNCSGKHSGFICLACATGDDPAGYVRPDHPTMREVTAALAATTGTALDGGEPRDGWLLDPDLRHPAAGSGARLRPLRHRRASRARAGEGGGAAPRGGGGQPVHGCRHRRFDTEVMEALARGCSPRPAPRACFAARSGGGLGIAVKCEDGAGRAAQAATAAVLRRFLPSRGEQVAVLDESPRRCCGTGTGSRSAGCVRRGRWPDPRREASVGGANFGTAADRGVRVLGIGGGMRRWPPAGRGPGRRRRSSDRGGSLVSLRASRHGGGARASAVTASPDCPVRGTRFRSW